MTTGYISQIEQNYIKQKLRLLKPKSLSDSIQILCSELEKQPQKKFSISFLADHFNIKRRRLYDVINVLISAGCCDKDEQKIVWRGKANACRKISVEFDARKIGDPYKTLSDLFPVQQCVGVPNLTTNFLLIYFALETKCLDLRIVASFFSRYTIRMKTTLSKLYQISYILCSIGMCRRNTQVCEVMLSDDFYDTIYNEKIKNSTLHPLSINELLNKPKDLVVTVESKRLEFRKCFQETAKSADFLQFF